MGMGKVTLDENFGHFDLRTSPTHTLKYNNIST
jgi:hypothetical protein